MFFLICSRSSRARAGPIWPHTGPYGSEKSIKNRLTRGLWGALHPALSYSLVSDNWVYTRGIPGYTSACVYILTNPFLGQVLQQILKPWQQTFHICTTPVFRRKIQNKSEEHIPIVPRLLLQAGCRWYGICTFWVENLLSEVILESFSSIFRPEIWRTR